MAEYLTWYALQLKAYCRRPGYWLEFAVLLILFATLRFMQLPQGNNMRIAVFSPGFEFSDEETAFSFISYDSEEEVQQAVQSGSADCGFLLPEDIEERINTGDDKKIITCISTALSTKEEIAKESIYAQILSVYSSRMLSEQLEVWDPDGENREALLAENTRLLSSDELFDLNREVESPEEAGEIPVKFLIKLAVLIAVIIHRIFSERKKILPYYRALTYLAMVTPLFILFII